MTRDLIHLHGDPIGVRLCFPSAAFGQVGDLSEQTLHGVWNPRESLSMTRKKQATESAAVQEIQGLERAGARDLQTYGNFVSMSSYEASSSFARFFGFHTILVNGGGRTLRISAL
jgi:hypothetical protein